MEMRRLMSVANGIATPEGDVEQLIADQGKTIRDQAAEIERLDAKCKRFANTVYELLQPSEGLSAQMERVIDNLEAKRRS